jgi:hypothetical protein
MLKENKMPPCLLDRVVHRATARATFGAIEAWPLFEVECDVEALVGCVELRGRDKPRRRDAERELKEVFVAYAAAVLG